MRVFKFVIFSILFILILSGCSTKENTLTSNIEVDLAESAYHSKNEIEEVVDLLKKHFSSIDTYDGCTLLGIYYSDTSHDLETRLINDEIEDAIIINFKFYTGSSPHMAFNKNETYDYSATFTKNKSENEWTLVSVGI